MSENLNPESEQLTRVIASLLDDIHAPGGLPKVLNSILYKAVKLVGAARGDFAIFRRGRLEFGAVYGDQTPETKAVGEMVPAGSFINSVWQGASDEVQIVSDVAIHLVRDQTYYCSDPSMVSEAAVRFHFRGRRTGVLNVESPRPNAFEHQGRALKLLADYAAIAVQVIEEETRSRELVEKVLRDAGDDDTTLRRVLEEILGVVNELYGFTSGLIYIADAEGTRLDVRGWYGTIRDGEPFGYRVGDNSAAIYVLTHPDNAYYTPDVKTHDGIVSMQGVEHFGINGPMIVVPLLYNRKPEGVLVSWSRSADVPSVWHEERLKPLATLAAWKIAMWKEGRKRHEAEEKMRLYQSIVSYIPVCIYRKDRDGIFRYANEPFWRDHLKQFSDRAVIGKRDEAFYPPDLADKFVKDDQRVIETGAPQRISELNRRTQSNHEISVEGFKVAIRDDHGNVVGTQGIFLEVSKHTDIVKRMKSLLDSRQTQIGVINGQARRLTDESDRLRSSLAAVTAQAVVEIVSAEEIGWVHPDGELKGLSVHSEDTSEHTASGNGGKNPATKAELGLLYLLRNPDAKLTEVAEAVKTSKSNLSESSLFKKWWRAIQQMRSNEPKRMGRMESEDVL